jgi:hypothetical protein
MPGSAATGRTAGATAPRFRFDEPNPTVMGRTYAQSLYAELPYMISVLVRTELHLTEAAWDSLVTAGVSLHLTGSGEYRMPLTLDVIAPPMQHPGRAPADVCPDCWGSGYSVDEDGTMTGVVGRLFVCFCAQRWT